MDARAELEEPLLTLSRIARIRVDFSKRIERSSVLRVRDVEGFHDQLDTGVAGDAELLAKTKVHLCERRTTRVIHVAVSRREILRIAVPIEIKLRVARGVEREDRVRLTGVPAKNSGERERERKTIHTAQSDAMTHISIERSVARAAIRIQRINAGIANRVGLMAGIGNAELVGARKDIALGARVRVEALRFEIVAET